MVGRVGIHPTKNNKSVIHPLFEYLKNPYLYPSVYMLMDEQFGWIGRVGRVWRFFAHP